MKIAFIGQKGIPAKLGGVEKHVEELAIKMAEKGHEVFAYARKNYTDSKLTEYKGIKIILLPSIGTKHLDAISHTFFSIVHALFQGYDIIHIHAIGPNILNFLVKFFGGKTKLVATHHCQDYYHQKWNWFAKNSLEIGEWMTCKVPDATIAVSKVLSSFIRNEYKTKPVYIPNGYSILRSENSNELSKFGLEKNNYILSVSRLIKHKGIHYLIKAFKKLEDQGLTNGKKLVIVGEGFHTDSYVSKLKELAEGRENIIFTGAQTGETLAQLFENTYLFVQPSQSEGLSITLLEAMGYGKGILISDIPENVGPLGQAGFHFENGNAEDLKEKLEYLFNNEDAIKEAGLQAQKIANEKYNWGRIADKTEAVYLKLIEEK